MAYETQQYVTSLVLNQIKPPNVWWSEDYQTLTCQGHILQMSQLRTGIQMIISQCWELYDTITKGRRFATKLPEYFEDNLPRADRGYSFLSHGPFTDQPHAFLTYLTSSESPWKIADIHGTAISWNVAVLRDFLSATSQFNQHLSWLTFVLPATGKRVSQHEQDKYTNDARSRNLHFILNDMINITSYSKMTNQTGLDVCVPSFYPAALKDLTLEYLAGGMRDCETLLSRFAYDEEASSLYKQ